MDNIKLDQAFRIAKQKVRKGLVEEAIRIHEDILEKFPDDVKRSLFVSADLGALAIALKGIDQEIVDGIIENQPQKRQAMFEPVDKPLPKREVDDARKKIVADAKKMEEDGDISLEDILGGGEMVE